MPEQPHSVVIGDIEVARRTCSELVAHGFAVTHLLHPTDSEMRVALTQAVSAVAVLVRGDVIALRYALLVEHLLPEVPLVVTLFDRTVAEQLVRVVPNCQVTSPANVAVPSIIGACVGPNVLAVSSQAGEPTMVLAAGEGIELRQWSRRGWLRRLPGALAGQVRPHDAATRFLFIGLSGLASILLLDWFLAVIALHEKAIRAFYIATRVVATVGPGDAEAHAPDWYQVLSSVSMLLTIVFTAVFTAGVINRLLSSRSIGIIGSRTIPTRDHVVVIGLGQVGLRLCIELRRLGISVVAVERDPRAVNLRLARAAKVPVLIAHGEDRGVLKKLSLHRARALAAMGAEDLDNIEVAIAALALAPDLRVVLRAGDGDVITETRSLFKIGEVRNVSALTAFAVALGLVGQTPRAVYARGHQMGAIPWAVPDAGTILDAELHRPSSRCDCGATPDV
ncbi:MAG: potassium channel family protein [Mycobacteriaceae bacterium]